MVDNAKDVSNVTKISNSCSKCKLIMFHLCARESRSHIVTPLPALKMASFVTNRSRSQMRGDLLRNTTQSSSFQFTQQKYTKEAPWAAMAIETKSATTSCIVKNKKKNYTIQNKAFWGRNVAIYLTKVLKELAQTSFWPHTSGSTSLLQSFYVLQNLSTLQKKKNITEN